MVVFISFSSDCLTEKYQSIKNDTLYFMSMLNLTLTCFKKYQQVCNAPDEDVYCEFICRS